MKIAAEGIVFKSQAKSDRQSCCFPSIAILPSGRWLCACRAAPAKKEPAGRYAARRKKWGKLEWADFFWNNAAGILGRSMQNSRKTLEVEQTAWEKDGA